MSDQIPQLQAKLKEKDSLESELTSLQQQLVKQQAHLKAKEQAFDIVKADLERQLVRKPCYLM